jgi:hypothetical protein
MLDCPVCPRTQIDADSCPQCGADLKPLLRLAELRAESEKPPVRERKPPYLAVVTFAAGLAFLPVWLKLHPPVIKTVIVKEPATQPAAPPEKLYTVRNGDSFWSIAKQKYGMGEMWKMIRDDNKDRLRRAGRLHAGEVIRLRTMTMAPK